MTTDAHVMWLVSPVGDDALSLDAGASFWKELIREGRWVNAKAGFTLEVDAARLEQWEQNFHAMADAGIRVPVPWGHSYDPRDNAGFVEEIELRDGGLWARLNVPDEDDAAKVGHTVRAVSVSINPDFVDGAGKRWGEVIEHVALTNYPVVTDQEDFVPASMGDATGGNGDGRRAMTLELVEQGSEDREQGTGNEEQGAGTRDEGQGTDNAEPDAASSEPPVVNPEHETRNSESVTENPAPSDETLDLELETLNADPAVPNSELTNRLYRLELERAEHEVDEALRLGKFTRPAAEALRQLIATGVERKYSFGTAGTDGVDVAATALDVIANTPAGAAVDMAEHTRVHVAPDPSGAAMTDAKASQLARENKVLAGV
jgi:hypothetical protein